MAVMVDCLVGLIRPRSIDLRLICSGELGLCYWQRCFGIGGSVEGLEGLSEVEWG